MEPVLDGADQNRPRRSAARWLTPNNTGLWLAFAFASLCTLAWATAFARSATHGFDLSDEGSYLLSYRWWNVSHRTFTGSQYLYGPVFQLLRWSVPGLRLFRLATVLISHALFGYAFMRWLRLRRPRAPASRLWEATGTAAIMAASGMTCSWLPLSPGYNDVALLGAVLAHAVLLRVATLLERAAPIPAWLPVAFGPLAVGMTLAKWASSAAILGPVVLVAAILVVSARGPSAGSREVLRLAALTLASAFACLVLVNVFLVRLDRALPEFLEVTRLLMKKANSPEYLLRSYWNATRALVISTIERHKLLLVAAGVVAVGRSPRAQAITGLLAIAAVHRSLVRVDESLGLLGGTVNLARYASTIFAVAMAAVALGVATLIAGRLDRLGPPSLCKESFRGWLVLGLLALLPIPHGLGTGNQLYTLIVNGFAGWMAICVAVVTGTDTSPLVARALALFVAAAGVAGSAQIARDGLLEHPYRTDAIAGTTSRVAGVPALRGVRLQPDVARRFATLRAALEPYVNPAGRAMVAYDEIAGVVLMLDGRPAGESWVASSDRERTAEGFRASCRAGAPWWASRWPIFIFQRPVSDVERASFAACGIDFAMQYRLLALPAQTSGLSVYVPAADPGKSD